jgi:TfoX/Sxy family transcriptional regulator of competence genes
VNALHSRDWAGLSYAASMAYDEQLADRIRAELANARDVVERKMFGGIAFMVSGSMAVGIIGNDLMARVGPEGYERALAKPHAGVMMFTGRPMRGFVLVEAKGIATRAALKKWVAECAAVARRQPKKTAKKKTKKKKTGRR